MYQLGVDLGTTWSAAAVCRAGGLAPEPVALGEHANAVASAVYAGADGSFLLGEAAERRALSDPDRVVVRVATGAPGLLVIADTWMPGWTARVDGRPAPIYRGNHAQRVVTLPRPGPHEIELRYEPPGFASGLAVTDEGVYVAALQGEALLRVPLAPDGVGDPQTLLAGELGRLRAVAVGADGDLYVLTNNTDGRGEPREGDDRLVPVVVTED